ncbi:hypothetical protein BKA56DRAFT_593925 [Ilyonectria sp. MPI-CAGE-AT-0026]|nr:hypothetical protein BKA56DRAFT_593925 [Ilyonectria sp. MPI-CAGE-AT-0026]
MDTFYPDVEVGFGDALGSQTISKAEPGKSERDIFVDSTISRDDTLGKHSKEKVMLESLADKFHSGSLPLKNVGDEGQFANPAAWSPFPPAVPTPSTYVEGALDLQNFDSDFYSQPELQRRMPITYPVNQSIRGRAGVLPHNSVPQRHSRAPFRPPIHGMPWDRPLQPPRMPVKADRYAEWRQRIPHSKAHGGPSVEGSQEAPVISSQPQTAAAECKNGVEGHACVVHDFGNTHSVESLQPAGDGSGENANEKVSGAETWKTPSEELLPPNLGLAGSLNYVADKYFGLDVLNQSTETAQFTGFLLDTIERLEKQLTYLRAGDDYGPMFEDEVEVGEEEEEGEEEDVLPRSQTLHKILCENPKHKHKRHSTMYEDEPSYDGKELTSKVPVYDLHAYLAQHSSICFIVVKEYNCMMQKKKGDRDLNLLKTKLITSERPETLQIVSPVLQKALETVARFKLQDGNEPFEMTQMNAPYNFLFHHRTPLAVLLEETEAYRAVLAPLLRFLDKNYGEEYESAEALFQRGRVSARHFGKLFKPNQMVLSRLQQTDGLDAFVLQDYPEHTQNGGKTRINFHGWSWKYNGTELQRSHLVEFIYPPLDGETAITDLDVHPVEFAHQSDIEELQRRGQKFWDHKAQVFVSYTGWDKNKEHCYVDSRFMVDVRTYKKMHPEPGFQGFLQDRPSKFDPWPLTRTQQDDLSKELMMLLPSTTYGFNMREKKWVTLNVKDIHPIKWNKMAFERLVLDDNKKQLIHALVDVHTSVKKMDDIIAGKGNGLIVLLHGSPGTGKTLTAESVAEIAAKPLYRVTCGDIGTEPSDVEKYLETVMYLGKIWDCVLLLDEADVFLEERTIADLQRNSMVSIFLRVLEYHEGILILTSNRVGTFDEAFKSRIQVAIHYNNLTKRSRKQIWMNFLDMMEDAGEDANVTEFKDRLDQLAAEEMNGRQIRNTLLTARQLAKHCKETLDWEHLDQAMKTSSAFNKYLRTLKGHSDEQWAKEEGIRL